MSFQLGMNGKLYCKPGGIAAGGSFNEITNAKDVTVTLEKGTADVSTRANNGWRASVGTLKELTFEWQMVWDTSDSRFTELQSAFLNNTVIAIKALDSPTGQGPQADCMITSFSRAEPLEEAMTVNVTAKVTYSSTAPSWVS